MFAVWDRCRRVFGAFVVNLCTRICIGIFTDQKLVYKEN